MRSHRLALTVVVIAGVPLAAAGCGSGKDTEAFLGSGVAKTPVAAPAEPAPVIIAGPDTKVVEERDAAKAAAAADRDAAAKADRERRQARRELREERDRARRAAERAARREARLRRALRVAARRRAAEEAAATPRPQNGGAKPDSISGSSTGPAPLVAERDRRSAAEARAAVVRMHELLDNRDIRACDVLTEKLLEQVYGSEEGALDRCRAAAAATDFPVGVTIADARAHGRSASVAAVSRLGDNEIEQTFRLVLVNGTWLIDAIERGHSR